MHLHRNIKTSLLRASVVLSSVFALLPAFAANYLTTPSDSSATPEAKSLYTYLATRRGAENNKMVEGQHLGGINQLYSHFDYDIHLINDGTSDRYPGLVGARYDSNLKVDPDTGANVPGHPYTLDSGLCTRINNELISVCTVAAPNPPIVHITAVARNPWDQTYGRDPSGADGNLSELYRTASHTTAWTNFWNDIDLIATSLGELQSAGIPVVFRPFAEFNQSNKYYFAGKVDTQFVQLWKDVRDYYVTTKGLHNLLFCWELWVLNRNSASSNVGSWYPGDSYVDVLGGSYYFNYDKTYVNGSGVFSFPSTYDSATHSILVGKGRPFGATQWGLDQNDPAADPLNPPPLADHNFTLSFMNFCPDLAFAYYWDSPQAVEQQRHTVEFVTEPRVATADDLPTMIFTSIGAEDGWILETGQDSGVGGTTSAGGTGTDALRAGDDTAKKQYKSIISFDTSPLPDNAIIDSATLKIKRGTLAGSVTNLGELRVDLKNGTFGTSALESSDFSASSTNGNAITGGLTQASGNDHWASGTVKSGALTSINKTGRTQFRLYFATNHDTDTTADYLGSYGGGSATTTDSVPVLEVRYHLP